MLIYAGIDEAGYGPLLGPLCVAGATFVLDDHDPAAGAPKMWGLLKHAVSRAGGDRRGRIAIDDSKKLKGARDAKQHPLCKLERGVLGFLSMIEKNLDCDDALFSRLGARPPECGWYAERTTLPLANDAAGLTIDVARLRRHLDSQRIRIHNLHCETIDAPEFNRQVDRMGNKAAVNLCAALRLIDRVWRDFPQEHPRIVIDRHGGRTHYREDLQLAWPEASITIIAESEACSRYHIADGCRELTVTFTTEAEQKHLPVALASMTAKYVRELMMLRMNRFFQSRMPELKPTAGYYGDGRRFVDDIAPVIQEMRIDRRELVRVC